MVTDRMAAVVQNKGVGVGSRPVGDDVADDRVDPLSVDVPKPDKQGRMDGAACGGHNESFEADRITWFVFGLAENEIGAIAFGAKEV